MKARAHNIIAAAIVALGVACLVALAIGASYACHRWVGPWMTGGDATATAIYCRPSR